MSEMTHYLCSWSEGSTSDHTIIKQGRDEVCDWLYECLRSRNIGFPEQIVNQLSTLDEDTGGGALPIQFTWQGHNHSYSITEITDLGALGPAGPDAVALKVIGEECRVALNWLNYGRFPPHSVREAKKVLGAALCLLGVPVDG